MGISAAELIQLIESDPELKRALQDRLVDADAIRRALQDPEKRDEIRRVVLGEEWEDIPTILRQLAEGQQRHEAILQEHSRILQEHTQQLAMLIETQQRHEAILQEHTQILKEHTRILQEHSNLLMRLESDFQALRGEFQGLAGKFEGKEYELRTIRRAPAIFNGGGGGPAGSPSVRRRLKRWLRAAFGEIPLNGDLADVYLSDLIWWKDRTVVVGEISIKVDRSDVLRAKYRAQLLEQAGVNAIPVVIGDEWALEETRDLARDEGVEWVVAKEYSEGAMEFRKLPETEGDDEGDSWEEY